MINARIFVLGYKISVKVKKQKKSQQNGADPTNRFHSQKGAFFSPTVQVNFFFGPFIFYNMLHASTNTLKGPFFADPTTLHENIL